MRGARAVVVLAGLLLAGPVRAQGASAQESPTVDTIYTTDGSVWRGTLVEQVPGKFYRIVLEGGSVVVIEASRVVRIAREPNADVEPAWAQPLAVSGLRVSVHSGVVIPTGSADYDNYDGYGPFQTDSNASATVSARAGYERISGAAGLTPAVFFEYSRLGIDDDVPVHVVHAGLQLRAAVHLGRLVPYAALGFGADVASFDATRLLTCDEPDRECRQGRGFGMHFAFGSDVLVTRRFALGLQMTIHPAITDLVTMEVRRDGYSYAESGPEIGYFAVSLGASLY